LHRHETASLGARGPRLAGLATEHARLLRLVLLAYTRWPGTTKQDPWPSNATLASRTGLEERQVERALVALRQAGIITTRVGRRQGARRVVGRLIKLDLHAPCKALAPEAFDVGNIWAITRSLRARPAALVTAMVGAYMLASDAAGGGIDEWSELGCSQAAWRRFIGQRDNASWTARVRELEGLGLLRREGRRVIVAPPRAWFALAVDVAEKRRGIGRAAPRSPSRAERPTLPQPQRLLRAWPEPPPFDGREDPAVWVPVELGRTGTDDAFVELDRGPPALHVLRPP
jgi:DNA-binding transcriptional ArsR family regulator